MPLGIFFSQYPYNLTHDVEFSIGFIETHPVLGRRQESVARLLGDANLGQVAHGCLHLFNHFIDGFHPGVVASRLYAWLIF